MNAYNILSARNVTRLCHFTRLKMLTHILSSNDGIVASNSIRQDVKDVVDAQRYDGELDHVCCSIEYPNSWFLDKAKERNTDKIFSEWVVIYVNLGILDIRQAKFCSCNAAKDWGRHIFNDQNYIEALFNSSTLSGRVRTPGMLSCCPTDDQAEILIKGNIPLTEITGIATGNADIAGRVSAMLKTYNIHDITINISPDVLSVKWSNLVRNGKRPEEKTFDF